VFLADDAPIVALVSGSNRLDTDRLGAALGRSISRADAATVRAATGFAIGGVAPVGHATPLRTFVEQSLAEYSEIWAAAGHPHTDQLHVTERYTRDSYETIRYEVTMEDPIVFTKPWQHVEIFRLRPNERLREYECIENNEDMVRFEKLLETDPALKKP